METKLAISGTCMRCGLAQNVSNYLWNAGKATCRACGGRLDAAVSVHASPAEQLRAKISQLESDPDVLKGQAISDAIHLHNRPPEEVYTKFQVDEHSAQTLMDKAILLHQWKKKMAKLDPTYQHDTPQH